jgi:hypothetical protein
MKPSPPPFVDHSLPLSDAACRFLNVDSPNPDFIRRLDNLMALIRYECALAHIANA